MTQPEALRLADLLDRMSLSTRWDKAAATELRRLHEVNQELLAALQWALNQIEDDLDPDHQAALDQARAAIAKATGGAA